jgi:NADH-quinone oxidoreductase subunit N
MPNRHSPGPASRLPLPRFISLVALCAILLVEAFAGEKRRGLADSLTLVVLVVGALVTAVYAHVSQSTTLFHGLYVADELGYVLKLAGFLIVAVTLVYSRAYLDQRDILRGEYGVLCLTALLGIFVLVSANSLITVYIGVELLALSVYALDRI